MANKKTGKALNCIIDKELYDRFDAYCEAVGQSKTTAIARILAKYLDEYDSSKAVNSNG